MHVWLNNNYARYLFYEIYMTSDIEYMDYVYKLECLLINEFVPSSDYRMYLNVLQVIYILHTYHFLV